MACAVEASNNWDISSSWKDESNHLKRKHFQTQRMDLGDDAAYSIMGNGITSWQEHPLELNPEIAVRNLFQIKAELAHSENLNIWYFCTGSTIAGIQEYILYLEIKSKWSGQQREFARHLYWLVVSTPLKNIRQLGWLFLVYGKS